MAKKKKPGKPPECLKDQHDLIMMESYPTYSIYGCKRPGCNFKKKIEWSK